MTLLLLANETVRSQSENCASSLGLPVAAPRYAARPTAGLIF